MRPEDFGPTAPGRLVPVGPTVGFIPNPLPPVLSISPALVAALDSARGAVSRLVGEASRVTNLELILRPLASREAVLSSRIEGTHTEIGQLLLADAVDPGGEFADPDEREVRNYLAALDFGQRLLESGRRLDTVLIRELHERLMRGVRGGDRHPGQLRGAQVYIGLRAGGIQTARFVPPPPEVVERLLDNLMEYAAAGPHLGPLVDGALVHYQFEAIHPFEDGNGRVGRLLIPLHLMAHGVLDRPLLYLSPYFEARPHEYRDRLLHVSTAGAWEDWIAFFLGAVTEQAQDTRNRVQLVLELYERYRLAVLESTRSRAPLMALDLVFSRIYVSTGDVSAFTGTSFPTARAAIETLARVGILRAAGRRRGREIWYAAELLEEVYSD